MFFFKFNCDNYITLLLTKVVNISRKINTFIPSQFIPSGTEKHDLVGLKKCPVCLRSPPDVEFRNH